MRKHSPQPWPQDEVQRLVALLLMQLPRDNALTVKDLFLAYRNYAQQHCRSAAKLEKNFNRYLAPFSDLLAHEVSPSAVMALHQRLGEQIGRATANRTLELLRTIYNKCIRWGLFYGVNPCLSVSAFRLKSRERFLNANELHRLLVELGYCRNTNFRSFIRVCLFTGARVSNVQSMRWQDVDLDVGIWRIPETKSGHSHSVPLLPEAILAIEAQKGRHPEWVFPGRGRTGHMVNPNRSWARLRCRSKLLDLRLHDLRRTLGSWQAATGASLPLIAKTLGHTSLSATQIYARLDLQPVRLAMERAVEAMLKSHQF